MPHLIGSISVGDNWLVISRKLLIKALPGKENERHYVLKD